jgi:hypothetical protein
MRTQLASRRVPAVSGGMLGWIHHEDAAAATVAALEHGRGGQAYNLVDDRPATWEEVITAMARAFGAPAPWKLPRRVFRLIAPLVASVAVDVHAVSAAGHMGNWRRVPDLSRRHRRWVSAVRQRRPQRTDHCVPGKLPPATIGPFWAVSASSVVPGFGDPVVEADSSPGSPVRAGNSSGCCWRAQEELAVIEPLLRAQWHQRRDRDQGRGRHQ